MSSIEQSPRMRRSRLRTIALFSCVALASASAIPALAVNGSISDSLRTQQVDNFDRSYSRLVKAVLPAVVNVQVERIETAMPGSQQSDPDLERFFERFFGQPMPRQEVPRERRGQGEGSGFIVDASGLIVTNAHVAGGAEKITVILQDGSKLPAKIRGIDPKTDLALIKVDTPKPLPFLEFGDSSTVEVGDKVIAVGNPFGLGGTVTSGIVSATGRELGSGPYDDFIQVDASINRGNSGGPTFNLQGEVVGVNSMIFSPTGGSVGIGFAISSNLAKQVVADLMDDGVIQRGWLGVGIQPLDEDLAQNLGLKEAKGAVITSIEPDSPAARASLQPGQVILEFDGKNIDRLRTLTRVVAAVTPGKTVDVVVWDGSKQHTVAVVIGVQPDAQQVAAKSQDIEPGTPRLGVALARLTPDTKRRLELRDNQQGVLVERVEPESPAAAKGIRAGDILTAVEGQVVNEPSEVVAAVRKAHEEGQKSVRLRLQRDGQQRFMAIPFGVS